jgi:uncharacterized membrane protein HdeD (DUF308 family)
MAFPDPDPRWTLQEVTATVRERTRWLELLGVGLILLGVLALGFVVLASVATTFLIGALLFVAGAAQIAAAIAFWQRRGGGFILGIILGALCVVSGVLCWINPGAGMQVLTLILGVYFVGSGIARSIINVQERFPGWGWGIATAASEVLLGVLTLAWWPNTSLFMLGAIVGVQLIFSGTTAFAVGSAVRAMLAPRAAEETPHHERPATRFQH